MPLPKVDSLTVEHVLHEFESTDDLRTYLIEIGERIRKTNPALLLVFPDFAKFLLSPSVRNFNDEPIRPVLLLYRLLEVQAQHEDVEAAIQQATKNVKKKP